MTKQECPEHYLEIISSKLGARFPNTKDMVFRCDLCIGMIQGTEETDDDTKSIAEETFKLNVLRWPFVIRGIMKEMLYTKNYIEREICCYKKERKGLLANPIFAFFGTKAAYHIDRQISAFELLLKMIDMRLEMYDTMLKRKEEKK